MGKYAPKYIVEGLARLGVAIPSGRIPLGYDPDNHCHFHTCRTSGTGRARQARTAAAPMTLTEMLPMPAAARQCHCLSGTYGTFQLISAAGGDRWMFDLLKHDDELRTAERLVERAGAAATSISKARIDNTARLVALESLRNEYCNDAVATGAIDGLVERITTMLALLAGGPDPRALEELADKVRRDAELTGNLDTTVLLARVRGRRSARVLVTAALDAWRVAGDDLCVVVTVEAWAIPWLVSRCERVALRCEITPVVNDLTLISAAGRFAADQTFSRLCDAVEAAQLIETPAR